MDLPLATALATPVIAGLEPTEAVRVALADFGVRFEPAWAPAQAEVLLRLETETGQPLNHRLTVAAYWHRRPYTLPLRLVRYNEASRTGETIDEAVIGTRGNLEEFRRHLERTAVRLVRDAMLGRSRGANASAMPDAAPPVRLTEGGFTGGWLTGGWPIGGWLDHVRSRWSERLLAEWWSIGVTVAAPAEMIASGGRLGEVTWLNPRKSAAYYADPFPWPSTNRILCEEMPMTGGHGRIVALSVDNGKIRSSETILEDAQHHSYPCTFRESNITYMMPEATERGATTLYRLAPDGSLDPVCAIASQRRLADATLFRHGGRYWIACADLDIGAYDSLCLFWAERLEGPWQQHRLNPARIDIRGARPAGPVFRIGHTLYRPGQDCAATYGAGITVHRIDLLTPDAYHETAVATLRPDAKGPFPHGLHTLASDGTRTWVDGKRFVFDWTSVRNKIAARLRLRALEPAGQVA